MERQEIGRLVALARQGDQEAKGELCRATYNSAYYNALKMMKNPDDALDVVQEAYLKAFAGLDKLEKDESFGVWLNRIVLNQTKDVIKKHKPTLFAEMRDGETEQELDFADDNIEFQPDEKLDYTETRRLVEHMVDALPEDQRLCVLLYYYDELGVAQIAETLGISENTVKSRLNYARKKVKLQVLELEEKDGIKLYASAAIPFLVWVLRQQARDTVIPQAGAQAILQAVASGGNGAGSAAGAGASAAGTAAGEAARTVSVKLIAAAIAGVLAVGGVVAGVVYAARDEEPAVEEVMQEILPEPEMQTEELLEAEESSEERLPEEEPETETEAEAVVVNPADALTVTFQGQNGSGNYQLAVSPELEQVLVVSQPDSGRQGSLRNGETVSFQLSLGADAGAAYRLAGTQHSVTVSGLQEAAALTSLQGTGHSVLDQQMMQRVEQEVQARYTGSTYDLEYRVIPQLGFFAVSDEDPAQNCYVTFYTMEYTRNYHSGANPSSSMVYMYLWSNDVTVDGGQLKAGPGGILYNQGPLFQVAKTDDEAQRIVEIHAVPMRTGTYSIERVAL